MVFTLSPEMRGPFWFSVLVFMLLFVVLMLVHIQGTRAERELREIRERGLDLGVLQ